MLFKFTLNYPSFFPPKKQSCCFWIANNCLFAISGTAAINLLKPIKTQIAIAYLGDAKETNQDIAKVC